MSHTFPAIRSKMGSTTYYHACVSARDLARLAKIAKELQEWTDWSIFERFQRDIAMRRVRREIVPYLVKTEDRFFGAFIIVVYQASLFEFQPLSIPELPPGRAYIQAAEKMGFLTIDGGSLVALDGQHRLVSLREVINAGDELVGPYRDEVGSDELVVVFLQHETFEKTRRIFNKVNRHAKPTTPSENIITSEDDGYSIVTRWLVEREPPLGLSGPTPPLSRLDRHGEPLVDWRNNQLKINSLKFTTLPHLHQTVQHILDANGILNFSEKAMVNRPSDEALRKAYTAAATWWTRVIDRFIHLRLGLWDPSHIPFFRATASDVSLLFRPSGQVTLFGGLSLAVQRGMDFETALTIAHSVNWSGTGSPLTGVIIGTNGKMKTRSQAVDRGSRLIEYLIAGDMMREGEIDTLERDLKEETDNPWYRLPTSTRRRR